jgi:hypothetical protein
MRSQQERKEKLLRERPWSWREAKALAKVRETEPARKLRGERAPRCAMFT